MALSFLGRLLVATGFNSLGVIAALLARFSLSGVRLL